MIRLLQSLFRRSSPIPLLSDLDGAVATSFDRPVLIYKHSNRCVYCLGVRDDLTRLVGSQDLDVTEVVVQRNRRLSSLIEDRFNIFHQTPQALLLHGGRCVWSASMGEVSAEAVRSAVAKARGSAVPDAAAEDRHP